jgi:hypothetical protein
MKLLLEREVSDSILVRDMLDNTFGIVTEGQFSGEIIWRNVAGWHSLTENRWWPSAHVEHKSGGTPYVPDFKVRVLAAGTTITITA